MHILFLTARLPYPPNRGDRLRVYHFIRELSRHNRITLLSFVAQEEEAANLAVRPYCDKIQLVHLSKRQSTLSAATRAWRSEPLQAMYYHSSIMQNAVDELLARESFDMVYVHLFRMAYVSPGHFQLPCARPDGCYPPKSPAPCPIWIGNGGQFTSCPVFGAMNVNWSGRINETWVISEAERSTLADAHAPGRIEVVPNGVDTDRYHPIGQRRDKPVILFVGHMGFSTMGMRPNFGP
ncbi:MAG: hypothetical protein R3C44_20010 [Chloroflexota bacterium]